MFKLTSSVLDLSELKENFLSSSAGAFVSFEGWVRDNNENKNVVSLEYEAHEELCGKEAQKIFDEAKEKFSIIDIRCVHRIGRLHVADTAIWVGVISAHRDDAFKACRYVIDELKKRLPIWKKEFYINGNSGWINCQQQPSSDCILSEGKYYSSQINLKEIGSAGQKKLKESRVLVVGAGGLGSTALMSLAGSGIGTIGICEFDSVAEDNLHRQPLYSADDIGLPKISLAEIRIKKLNPYINIILHPIKLDVHNACDVLAGYDIILDCTDNFESKFLINDAAYLLNKTLIQAGIYQFDGQMRVITPETACLRCLWPVIPDSGCVDSCAQAGVLGAAANILGHWQALEAVKITAGMPAQKDCLVIDFSTNSISSIKTEKNDQCPLCSSRAKITGLQQKNYLSSSFSVHISDIVNKRADEYTFVDIREYNEVAKDPLNINDSIHFPLSRFEKEFYAFDKSQKYLLVCAKGVRSLKLARKLREEGKDNIYCLHHGLQALKT